MSESERGFKVVDRRRFNMEGDEREGAPEDAPPPAPVAVAPEKAEASTTPRPVPEEVETEGGLTFSIFVQSLAQQAMMQLGLVPWPHNGQRALQLEQARDTIDVLSLLDIKTKENLTAAEKDLLTTVLYELRLTYVEINQQLAAAAKPGGPV